MQIRNSRHGLKLNSTQRIKCINEYISQCIQRHVKKQYYSLCHRDSQAKEDSQSCSHGCLMYRFDWRCIILLLSLITQCCSKWEVIGKTKLSTRDRERGRMEIKYKTVFSVNRGSNMVNSKHLCSSERQGIH